MMRRWRAARELFSVLTLPGTLGRLDLLGDDVGRAIGAAEKDVGFFVGDDLLGRGFEF